MKRTAPPQKSEMLSLNDFARYLLDEARLVLPGIQSMFGFQLIVIFTDAFNKLEPSQRLVHLVALSLMAIAIAVIMTPAAIHRERGSREIREDFINVSSWLILISMFPLAAGLCLDFYLVVSVIINLQWAAALSALLFAAFVFFWIVLPKSRRLQDAVQSPK